MPSFSTVRRVPFTPRQMYDLVADVERYPEFLPLCAGLEIRARREQAGQTVLVADMTVAYRLLRETFRTEVELDPDGPAILVRYIEGPFSHLENRWRFRTAPEGSDVDFHIDYAFRNPMLGLLVGAVFEQAFRRFAEAFEERARRLYGPASGIAAPGALSPSAT
jgi:coenzyme Q-binding protein COQ10